MAGSRTHSLKNARRAIKLSRVGYLYLPEKEHASTVKKTALQTKLQCLHRVCFRGAETNNHPGSPGDSHAERCVRAQQIATRSRFVSGSSPKYRIFHSVISRARLSAVFEIFPDAMS
jgi:hypothetical protein